MRFRWQGPHCRIRFNAPAPGRMPSPTVDTLLSSLAWRLAQDLPGPVLRSGEAELGRWTNSRRRSRRLFPSRLLRPRALRCRPGTARGHQRVTPRTRRPSSRTVVPWMDISGTRSPRTLFPNLQHRRPGVVRPAGGLVIAPAHGYRPPAAAREHPARAWLPRRGPRKAGGSTGCRSARAHRGCT
jgi:hypothetical protein